MVTIEDVKKRLEHYERLKLAGLEVPGADAGSPAILWIAYRDGNESWEVQSEWVANLIVSDLHNSKTVSRAAVYRKPPDHAPFGVVRKWAAQFFKEAGDANH